MEQAQHHEPADPNPATNASKRNLRQASSPKYHRHAHQPPPLHTPSRNERGSPLLCCRQPPGPGTAHDETGSSRCRG
eukprot:scaffold129040_cov37-Tisochrysis_lutea.AAC.1